MKKNLKNKKQKATNTYVLRAPWLVIAMFTLAVGCTSPDKHEAHADTYTCPMHPTVISNEPGTCPVCAMDLVRKARPGEEVKITDELSSLIASPNEAVVSSIKTIKGEYKSLPVSVAVRGVVTYDTRNEYTISARTGGRLEKVMVKYPYQQVQAGQKVVEIYSPELLTAQRELLYLVEYDPADSAMLESAKNKLYLLGATPRQVQAMIKQKEAPATFAVYSAHSGYVIRGDQQPPTVSATLPASGASAMAGDGMGGSPGARAPLAAATPMNVTTTALLREGNYVSTGQTLFKIVNTSSLRIELAVPIAFAGQLKIKDEITLQAGHRDISGKVDFIQPFFDDGEEFIIVRLYLNNTHQLRIGELVEATIQLEPVEALWVPREAVLDLGLEQIVFVKERGIFKAKVVQVGARAGAWTVVSSGLSSADEIAVNAQYLVDSESFIKTK